MLKRGSVMRASVAILLFGIFALVLFRMTNVVSLRELAKSNGAVHSIAAELASVGRQSFGWRLARDESHIALALREPILGAGRWNWWDSSDTRPWSLWLLILGMYGLVGLVAFGTILFWPIFRAAWSPADRNDADSNNIQQAFVALILMVALDSLLNGALILPYLVLIGGVASGHFRLVAENSVRPDRRRLPSGARH